MYRFRKANRLLNAAAFGRVFKQATRSGDKWFTVLCRDNSMDIARLGLAISKKKCRRAAARNRIKRIVRESFRQHQDELAGLDVVVLNQAVTPSGSNRELFDSLARHWRRCAQSAGSAKRQDNP